MKAKLIKTDDGYHLKGLIKDVPKGINVYNKINDKECHFGFGTHSGKLSIKNCEAIELGYDLYELEELAQKDIHNLKPINPHPTSFFAGYRRGFQTALEILGDKKFSEFDITKAFEYGWNQRHFGKTDEDELRVIQKIFIQSLQQTEWQVEVIMDRIPADLAPDGWDVFPKLDAEGCLILKKI
jgi:hypothetical protein